MNYLSDIVLAVYLKKYIKKIKSVTMVTDFLRQKSYYKITRKHIKQITIHSN